MQTATPPRSRRRPSRGERSDAAQQAAKPKEEGTSRFQIFPCRPKGTALALTGGQRGNQRPRRHKAPHTARRRTASGKTGGFPRNLKSFLAVPKGTAPALTGGQRGNQRPRRHKASHATGQPPQLAAHRTHSKKCWPALAEREGKFLTQRIFLLHPTIVSAAPPRSRRQNRRIPSQFKIFPRRPIGTAPCASRDSAAIKSLTPPGSCRNSQHTGRIL